MTISVTSVILSQVEDGAQDILKTSWEGCPGALPFSFALSTSWASGATAYRRGLGASVLSWASYHLCKAFVNGTKVPQHRDLGGAFHTLIA